MKTKNIALGLTVVTLWASTTVAGKYLVTGENSLHPAQLALYRYLLGTIGLIIILIITKKAKLKTLRTKTPKTKYLIITTITSAMFPLLLFYGVQKTTAIASGILLNANTIFIAILSVILLKEKITKTQATGIITAFTGVILVFLNEGKITTIITTSKQAIIGDLLALASGICWAILTIMLKAWFNEIDPLETMTYNITTATIILIPITMTQSTLKIPITPQIITLLILLGIGATSIAFYFYTIVLTEETATITGAIQLAVPVLGTLLSMIFLKEKLTIISIAGIILVIIGLYLVINYPSKTMNNQTHQLNSNNIITKTK